jgi:CBS domain-containing protein
MRAKDIMIPVQDFLTPENTLKEAVILLKTARRGEAGVGVKGLPVLDADSRIIGMLSMRDILKAVFPFYMTMMDLGDFTWDGMLEDIAKRSSQRKVGEIMSKEVITVPAEAPLMECIDRMLKHNIKRLPVITEEGRLTGMIYERDVFFVITKAMLN